MVIPQTNHLFKKQNKKPQSHREPQGWSPEDHSWWSSTVVSSFCPLDQLEGNISRFELSKDNCVLVVVKLARSVAP